MHTEGGQRGLGEEIGATVIVCVAHRLFPVSASWSIFHSGLQSLREILQRLCRLGLGCLGCPFPCHLVRFLFLHMLSHSGLHPGRWNVMFETLGLV